MSSNSLNKVVREKVSMYFQSVVKEKYIMDFGGGTGADLNWLARNKYEICFCEPSKAMRNIAIELNNKKIKNEQIHFLNDTQTDFREWDSSTFAKKLDAVLANFCVFNSIDNIPLLFSKLNLLIKPGGHIIAVLLDTTVSGIFKYYSKNFIVSFVRKSYPVLVVQHSDSTHTVYLHTPNKIKQALPKNFSLTKIESLGSPGFMLMHFQKHDYAV
jgi:SAM-dependent methyltransferase